jgi:DNA mismatch repair protein MutL
VTDNGTGMTAEDAVLSLQRHATSKIRSSDDLFEIRTLGFRGEALPSIASVSHLALVTKTPEEPAGTRIEVHGGDIDSVSEVGVREGTTVIVEDLFYNTPARLKFLKSTSTEVSRAVDVVGNLAISHPGISFRVRHREQEMFSTPGTGDSLAALSAVWGREVARNLIPITYESPGLNVRGFVCTPEHTRPGRSHELFFVNSRPIRSRVLGHAVEDAVRSLTPEGRFPIAAVFVDIAPNMVDVNVHPTKTEVKFTRDNEVHHAVSQAVKQALLNYGIVPTLTDFARSWTGVQSSPPASSHPTIPGRDFEALARAAVELYAPPNPDHVAQPDPSEPSPLMVPVAPRPFQEQLRGFRVLGQAKNTYIVALTDEGIAVVDQHVAHERVLYEYLTMKRREQGIPSQRLTDPISLSLGAAEGALLKQRLEDFAAAGWEIDAFGRDSFLVRTVPSFTRRKDVEALLRDMVDELAHQSISRRLIVQREHVTITNACKMAVKAGDPLTMEEMTGLLAQLAETENPYLCPHGRPIVITIPFLEIDRKFKRA